MSDRSSAARSEGANPGDRTARTKSATLPIPVRRCADHLVKVLLAAGVDTFLGVPGGAISPIYDALVDHPGVRVVHVRHETNALFMAVGQHRLRPASIPCVLVTSGPGVTNAVTGIAAVAGEGVPAIIIGGEVPRSKFGRQALQEGSGEAIDVVNIVRSVTRSSEILSIPSRAPFQLEAAIERARRERGPVFLSLPLDVAMAKAPPSIFAPATVGPSGCSGVAVDRAVAALRAAKNPLVLVGSGARGAAKDVRALAERLGAPVVTSPKAKGIVSETEPYCLGVFGYGGHASALDFLRSAPDVVLALGCGFSEPSTNSWSPLLQASDTMIQVDIDMAHFGRNYRVDIGIAGDCADVVPAILSRLGDGGPSSARSFTGLQHFEPEAREEIHTPLRPARVLTVLQEEVPDDTVYTADIGEHLLFVIHYLTCTRPDQFIASLSLGSMGSGVGAAIGAKLASPDRTVVGICGDYGFLMYGMDLHTCVQEKVGVVFLVMNDARMRMVEAGIDRIYGRGLPMDGPLVDYAKLAEAQGATGFVVKTEDDLRRALQNLSSDCPNVIDVRLAPDAVFPVNARVQEISNFTAK